MLLRNVWRFGVIGLLLAVASNPASSREGETSMLVIRVAMSPELSIRDQHIDLTILKSFVLSANRLPDVAPCKLSLPFQIEYVFGEFAVTVRHPKPKRMREQLSGIPHAQQWDRIKHLPFVSV
ncbi:hypothetical protein [Bradyrhizobium sp.]|uniref:hypothetical protein n=1 Tax=Bradyrhizobium sp. TaxID=376 RepID=UPI0023939EF0|nr:hypothetical protein [Bradyrhizobium sp.]MDE2377291.1 hypothetical protein [Bradyrhizobium sp.]